jgi:hypothetical protein
VNSPGVQEPESEENQVPLTAAEHAEYRSGAGLFQYIAEDRADLKFSTKELLRDASGPTALSKKKLKRMVRYIAGTPRVVNTFPWLDKHDEKMIDVLIYSDADFAGCLKTRRSTSCGVVQLKFSHKNEYDTEPRASVMDYSITQPTVSLSSGESEFKAIVKALVTAVYLKNFIEWLGFETRSEVLTDSSAAKGMISRLGVGKKAKHIQTQFLYAQELIRGEIVRIGTVGTIKNLGDIGTKYLDGKRLSYLMSLMGLKVLALSSLVDGAVAQKVGVLHKGSSQEDNESSSMSTLSWWLMTCLMMLGILKLFELVNIAKVIATQKTVSMQTQTNPEVGGETQTDPEVDVDAQAEAESVVPPPLPVHAVRRYFKTRYGERLHVRASCSTLHKSHTLEGFDVCKVCG